MESLGDILETHVPLPQNESRPSKKKKVQKLPAAGIKKVFVCYIPVFKCSFCFQNIPLEINEDLISLGEILEVSVFNTVFLINWKKKSHYICLHICIIMHLI